MKDAKDTVGEIASAIMAITIFLAFISLLTGSFLAMLAFMDWLVASGVPVWLSFLILSGVLVLIAGGALAVVTLSLISSKVDGEQDED